MLSTKRMSVAMAAALVLGATILAGCNIETKAASPSADALQAKQTAEMVKAAAQSVGMPNITNFTEKRFAKLIYELKDQEVATYTYTVDMQGRLHFLCNSIGYGVSASVQYSNPERVLHGSHRSTYGAYGAVTIPQPEPNGLFMPEGLAATYVICTDGKGNLKPIYSEPELIVSPFQLKTAGDPYQ